MTTVYQHTVRDIDGESLSLSSFQGKVLLLVNVASACGLTPQYKALQSLYAAHAGEGFEVLAFPCNQFGGQEPGSHAEIQTFCEINYGVKFPLFEKIEVNGPNAHPLYASLTALATQPDGAGPIKWNFAKFLVSRSGEVIARFSPMEDPAGAVIGSAVKAALAA